MNLKKLVVVGCMGVALAGMVTVTGCHTTNHESGERTAGRELDDKAIQSDVADRLKKEPVYKFSDVDVKTFDGIVQLSGFVNTEDQKRRAEEIARNVPGVQQVVNNLVLKPGGDRLTPTGAETSTERPANRP